MTQIHQDISSNSLQGGSLNETNVSVEKAISSQEETKPQRSRQDVHSFFGEWTRSNSSHELVNTQTARQIELHPSAPDSVKPKALWQADTALISVASSLTVAKAPRVDAGQTVGEWSRIVEEARELVCKDIRPYILEKEKQQHKELLIKLESNQIHFASEKERFELLESTKESLRGVAQEMRKARPQYTRALKSLKHFADKVIEASRTQEDAAIRAMLLDGSVTFLEEMMNPVETSWKGIPGKSEDLPRTRTEDEDALTRLNNIKEHLSLKIEAIDAKQFRRLEKVASHPVIKEIIDRHASGDLPREGSIIFFMDNERPLLRIDACSNPKPRPGQSRESAIQHAVKTPEFLDIKRLDKGIGPDGAGLFRFAELSDRIIGAVILTPVIQNGETVKLPGMKKPKRQVNEKIGEIPECVEDSMSYGAVLNKFRPKIEKLLAEKLMR